MGKRCLVRLKKTLRGFEQNLFKPFFYINNIMINYNILDSNTFIGQSGKREVMHFETSEELLADMKYYNISEA